MPKKKAPAARVAFAKRLRAYRELAGFRTAKEFADRIGKEENTYTRYERAETEPDISTLMLICLTLDITPNDLLHPGVNATTYRTGAQELGKGRHLKR